MSLIFIELGKGKWEKNTEEGRNAGTKKLPPAPYFAILWSFDLNRSGGCPRDAFRLPIYGLTANADRQAPILSIE